MNARLGTWWLAALLATAATGAAAAPPVPSERDVAYGSAPRQRLDVYGSNEASRGGGLAPIIVMVHGGAWRFGDKASRGVVGAKAAHFLARGFVFVSVDNRLLPEADPVAQADDVARAVAFVQRRARGWGGDPARLVLMGHSAGAHLVALLGASPVAARTAGTESWAATITLDSAALDIASLMRRRHARLYDAAFGADPARWADASPTARLSADATPFLLVCSTLRRDGSCGEAERFAARARAIGGRAEVLPQALDHGGVNATLGETGDYTDAVDAFIASLPAMR